MFSEQRTTQQGQVYFLHTRTGVSTWHDPRVPRYYLFLYNFFSSLNILRFSTAQLLLSYNDCQ